MPCTKNTSLFIQESKSIFGDRYLYDKVVYIRNHIKVTITCRQHGDFLIKPYNHTSGKHGCVKCSRIKGARSSRRFAKNSRQDVSNIQVPINSKAVPITKNQYAIVDDIDFEMVMKHNWGCSNGYARTDKFSMHRFILDFWDLSFDIDHANGNKLDNRRSNLRICTRSQNAINNPARKNTSSIFKGVTMRKNGMSWSAQIAFNGKLINLGTFRVEEAAAKAYDNKAIELYGDFAWLNFPNNLKPLQSTKQ